VYLQADGKEGDKVGGGKSNEGDLSVGIFYLIFILWDKTSARLNQKTLRKEVVLMNLFGFYGWVYDDNNRYFSRQQYTSTV
jgi:hypothetical protein